MILAILELFRRMDNETIEAFIREHKDELRDEKILSVCGGAGSVREDPAAKTGWRTNCCLCL